MSDDDWDADAAAARAVGAQADGDLDGSDHVADAGDDAGDSSSDGDDGDGGSSSGGSSSSRSLKGIALAFFTADEHGPRAETWREKGVSENLAHILDGTTDWVLDLVGRDPGDSLGPAGKIGLGLSGITGGSSSDDADRDDTGSSSDDGPDPVDLPGDGV